MSNTTIPDPFDVDLARRVSIFLASRNRAGLRKLQVEAKGGTVVLRGTVGTFYEKQLSQLCSRHVAGVVQLIDEVFVEIGTPSLSTIAPQINNSDSALFVL